MVKVSKKGGGIAEQLYLQLNDTSTFFDNSKLFAGFMLILLNITTKYVKFKLSPSIESFLKNSLGVEFFIFIILLVGTKNLFVSIIITGVFILVFNFLLNEESQFSILPEYFTQYYNNLDSDSQHQTFNEEIVKDSKKKIGDVNYSPVPLENDVAGKINFVGASTTNIPIEFYL